MESYKFVELLLGLSGDSRIISYITETASVEGHQKPVASRAELRSSLAGFDFIKVDV